MPAFDLRGIQIGKYTNTTGTVTYETPQTIGDAMSCNLELKFAEGRLYAESTLAEYMKMATGGTISIGVKYIPAAAQKLLYGAAEKKRTVGENEVSGLAFGAKDAPAYVGVAFYAPDKIDGVQKFTCVFVRKVLFGPPALSFQTVGDSIAFQTPTTTGEFLAEDSADKVLFETAVCDTEAEALAWITAVLA